MRLTELQDAKVKSLDGKTLGRVHEVHCDKGAVVAIMALCEVGSISERRTSVLVDPKMSGLPPFLVEDSGVNSGLMIPQVAAAALVSENKSLAYPASVDSIPTSAGQEDHAASGRTAAPSRLAI